MSTPITLLVGAFPPEVGTLAAALARHPDYHVCVGGIGSVACALGVATELARLENVVEVLFVGSAGIYPGHDPAARTLPPEVAERVRPGHASLGSVAVSAEFTRHDLGVLWGHARLPGPMQDRIVTRPGPVARRLLEQSDVLRGATNSPDAVSLLLPPDKPALASFENMEAFGAALACSRLGLPFAAALALTNLVGPDGSAQWFSNHKDFGQVLQERILSVL